MKPFISIAVLSAFAIYSHAQTPEQVITRVKLAQQNLKTAYYKLERQDTLVTGTVRTMAGEVKLSALPGDSIFGFRFWAIRNGINSESIYDGLASFYINHEKKTFSIDTKPELVEAIVGKPGGQLILPDLVRIDTSKATGLELTEDENNYYLRILLPDIDLYDVRKRSKTLIIDKKMMLPVGSRHHQETLGKVQDLYYRIKVIKVNEQSLAYDFSMQRYPVNYKPEDQYENKKLLSLFGKDYPSFNFISFEGKSLSSDIFKGKVVLLDFWEVWCGPCIASIPNLEALQQKYKSKGFDVYGIIHDKENLQPSKSLAQKMKVSFELGVGNEQSRNVYAVNALPLYVLIGRSGKISYISEGYSALLEEEIKKQLSL